MNSYDFFAEQLECGSDAYLDNFSPFLDPMSNKKSVT